MTIPRQWNSTIPERKKPIKRGGKVRATNPERQKKANARYAKKLAAYKQSETYALVEVRSGGQCEYATTVRCPWPAVDHHHKTYARFGGKELLKDITHVCVLHHAYLESLKPAGNRRSRSRRASVGAG